MRAAMTCVVPVFFLVGLMGTSTQGAWIVEWEPITLNDSTELAYTVWEFDADAGDLPDGLDGYDGLSTTGFLYLFQVRGPVSDLTVSPIYEATSWGILGGAGYFGVQQTPQSPGVSFGEGSLTYSSGSGNTQPVFGFTSPYGPVMHLGTVSTSLGTGATASVPVPVPEPSTYVALAGLVPVLWVFRRRLLGSKSSPRL